MALSDMLFNNTHSVEELVDIKKQKKVDKVLLKVIRVIRSKGNLNGWVKPEANLKTDLKLSDKVILSIKKTLSEYYGIDLVKNKSLLTAKAMVVYIKTNKPNVADSIFLINADQQEVDTDDEVQLDDEMADPNINVPRPTDPVPPEEPGSEDEPHTPEVGTPVETPTAAPVIDKPTAELAEDPETVEKSEPDVEPETPVADPKEVGNDVEVSTEGLNVAKGKMVWTYYVSEKEVPKNTMLTVGAPAKSQYICQVFPTKDALIAEQTKNGAAMGIKKGMVIPYALGIPFNFIKKYLTRRGKIPVIGAKVKVPSNICILDRIPVAKYSKEGLDVAPAKAQSWAEVMNNL